MFIPRELDFPDREVCGIDEAGRGPLAGPLSLGLVCFSKEVFQKALRGEVLQGIGDSKKLTGKKREELYEELLCLPLTISHVFLPAFVIDNRGLSWCIRRGIEKLLQKSRLKNSYLLIDGNYRFSPELGQTVGFSYESIVKGDERILSISAASIIAKVRRDRYMVKMDGKYPEYRFSVHKGYGTAMHQKIISEIGLSPIHRKSFCKNFIR